MKKIALLCTFIGLTGTASAAKYRYNEYQFRKPIEGNVVTEQVDRNGRKVIIKPPFQDFGIGLSDVTIDTPPLRDQGGVTIHFPYQLKTYTEGLSLLDSIKMCLKYSAKSENLGGGASIALCRMGNKSAVLGERFGYGAFMKKNKDPIKMVSSLNQRCRERGGVIESVFVPL